MGEVIWGTVGYIDNDIVISKRSSNYGKSPHKGIVLWLRAQTLHNKGKCTTDSTWWDRIIYRYAGEVLNMDIPEKNAKVKVSRKIQENWQQFTEWVKENYKE